MDIKTERGIIKMYFSPSCECGTKLEVTETQVIKICYVINGNGHLKKHRKENEIIHESKLKCPHCWKTYPLLMDKKNRVRRP